MRLQNPSWGRSAFSTMPKWQRGHGEHVARKEYRKIFVQSELSVGLCLKDFRRVLSVVLTAEYEVNVWLFKYACCEMFGYLNTLAVIGCLYYQNELWKDRAFQHFRQNKINIKYTWERKPAAQALVLMTSKPPCPLQPLEGTLPQIICLTPLPSPGARANLKLCF